MQVASQSMGSTCINNSKLNLDAFKSSIKSYECLTKAHDVILNMIITLGSLQIQRPKILPIFSYHTTGFDWRFVQRFPLRFAHLL